jgi:hypothetical protein
MEQRLNLSSENPRSAATRRRGGSSAPLEQTSREREAEGEGERARGGATCGVVAVGGIGGMGGHPAPLLSIARRERQVRDAPAPAPAPATEEGRRKGTGNGLVWPGVTTLWFRPQSVIGFRGEKKGSVTLAR